MRAILRPPRQGGYISPAGSILPHTLPHTMFRIAEESGARRRTPSVYHMPDFPPFITYFWMMLDANGKKHWRMGWDSNPRDALTPAGFQDRFLQPLGHPSLRLNSAG